MKKYLKTLFILFAIFICNSCSQNSKSIAQPNNEFFVANWNVENLFDTVDDPKKNDEWFLPESEINWNEEKLNTKMKNLAKVINYMNNGNGPDILGFEEVENKFVMEILVDKYLDNSKYKIAHSESPDGRGIDNALIYNSEKFDLQNSESIKIKFDEKKSSRDILHTTLKLKMTEELIHVFVNHWPSRREGLKETEKFRIDAAETLIEVINEIKVENENSNIIVIGDFNDLPSNHSISKVIGAVKVNCNENNSENFLYNLAYNRFQKGEGSYKFRDHWNMLDQIIISKGFFDFKNSEYNCDSFEIINPEFIIEKEGKYKGDPFPTYGGKKYLGGYSDHFPVGAKFFVKK
ncbi:MAG: endonuclease [Ignavibacteriae bacterium]|nr:endonuclease [Ignavibacteriota bacterium]